MIKRKPKINTRGIKTERVSGREMHKSNVPKDDEPIKVQSTRKSSKASASKVLGIHLNQTTASYTADAMKEYGTEVVEQRAIPDFRDGLKPVQRMALWSMYKLGIHNGSGYKKSARVVGDCFVKGTLVDTPDRGKVAIEDLIKGDLVVTDKGVFPVTELFIMEPKPIIRVGTGDAVVECTPDQIFYSVDYQGNEIEVRAKDIQLGIKLCKMAETNGQRPSLELVEVTSVEFLKERETYDIQVDTRHRFFANAFLVHNCIAKYHPHGDQSVYQAMVGIAGTKFQGNKVGWATRNCSVPLIEGQGNWGDFIDAAAAYRYSECRLSKFSDLFLLDPDYLAVMDYLPNYDDSEKVPVIFPAKVPVLLLNGFSSIAVGVSGSSAPFKLDGVLKLTRKALNGEDITLRDCVKNLEFDYPYGGVNINDPKELVPVFKGKGSASFMPSYELSEDKKTLTFVNVCPGLMSSRSIETFLDKLASVKGVSTVDDGSNKYGARYIVEFSRTLKGVELDRVVDQVLDLSVRTDDYDMGITIRDTHGRATFKRSNVPETFKLWAEWRISVEVKVITRLISLQEIAKTRQELMLLAVDNLDTIIKALRVKQDKVEVKVKGSDGKAVSTAVDGSAAFLMKALSISLEQANSILDMKVRQLKALERDKIKLKIQEHVKELKALNAYLKIPHTRVLEELDKIMKVQL